MPSLAQGYGRGMLLGLRLQEFAAEQEQQQRKAEEEREKKRSILSIMSRFPELQEAFGLAEAGVPWGTALGATDYVPPAEQKKQAMMGDLTQLQSVYGEGIIPGILEHHNVPTETKGRIAEMFPLKQMFPGMYPEKAGREKETYGDWLRGEKTKKMLKDRAGEPAARETKLKDYHQKFVTAWGKELDKGIDPKTGKVWEDTAENKFTFFREWRDQNVLPGYKNELGKRLGFYNKSTGVSEGINRVMGLQPFQASGVTKEEDEFIKEARGREDSIDWEKIATKYPKWNLFYIKQKLGVNE